MTLEIPVNEFSNRESYHVSYCFRGSLANTTAVVYRDSRAFIILKGNHYEELKKKPDFFSCIQYVKSNIEMLHSNSDTTIPELCEITADNFAEKVRLILLDMAKTEVEHKISKLI